MLSGLAQEQKKEIWAYAKVQTKREQNSCRTLYITPPFPIKGVDAKNYKKIQPLAEQELQHDLESGILDIHNHDNVYVKVYDTKAKAFESWEKRLKNERDWALRSDFSQSCEPVEIVWCYTGKTFGENQWYSIYEDGWKDVTAMDSIKSHLAHLEGMLGKKLEKGYFDVRIRQRNMNMFKNGRLLEFLRKNEGEKALLTYVLILNESSFLLHGDGDKLVKRLTEERPYLFEDDQIIDYIKLLINTLNSEKLGRATVLTRERLSKEDFVLKQSELKWSFTLTDPRVLYESRDESIVAAYVYIHGELLHAIIELDRRHSKIDLLKSIRVLNHMDYHVGHATQEGIWVEPPRKM